MAKDLPLHERIVAKINQPGVSLADRELDSDVRDWIDTQASSLNLVIGQKGIPVGRLTLLVGHEATGKSTALVHLIAETQRRGGTAVLIDDENRWSRDRASIIGVDHDKLITVRGMHLEDTLKTILTMCKDIRELESNALVLIGWDSIAASPTEGQLKGEYMPAEHARLISRYLREIHATIAHHRIALVIVNQFRARMDFGGAAFMRRRGPKSTMLADKSLSFYSSLKIEFSNAGSLGDDKDRPEGINMRASTRFNDGGKNTVARPERTGLIPLRFDTGYDKAGAAFEAAVEGKLIELSSAGSSWWVYGDKKFQRGTWSEVLAETDIRERLVELPLAWKLEREKKVAGA